MWYYLPNPSPTSHFAAASECSIEDFTRQWSASDSERGAYVTVSGTATPRPPSWRGWKSRPWITRLSGRTLTPSQRQTSWAEWVQSLPAFPAKATASPENAGSPTTPETSGRRPASSSATPAPASLRWRMLEGYLFPTDKTDSKLESAGLSMTWPKTGGWEGGELFELPTLAQAIAANGCFFSPLDWQSPGANLGSAGCASRSGDRMGERLLTGQAKDFPEMWTTAQAHDVTKRGAGQVPSAKAGNACLHTDAINWPTASARDHKGVNQRLAARGTLDQLPNAAEQWPTCHGIGGQNGATASEIGQSDSKFPPSHQPETPTPNGSAYSDLIQLLCQLYHVTSEAEFRAAKKSLNPRFAAWLMGWPADWAFVPTNFAASAMASSGNVLQQHTTNSPGGCLGVGDMQANVIDQGVHDSPVLAGGAA